MRYIYKFCLIFFLMVSMLGCNKLVNKAGAEYLKFSLKGTCGEEDTACINAVETQFDSCHKKYEKDWENYMNSSISEEDQLLAVYSTNMYGCIVDEDGEPYFYFDPDSI